MSAAAATARGPQRVLDVAGPRAGHTRITERALRKVIAAVTAHAFAIPADRVSVEIHDVRGRLGITAAVVILVPSLLHAARAGSAADRDGTVYARASRAREAIIVRVGQLAGTVVGRVDIRITGIHRVKEARVR